MGDMYGSVCSNEVAVTDPDAFEALIRSVSWNIDDYLDFNFGVGSRRQAVPEGAAVVKFFAVDVIDASAVPVEGFEDGSNDVGLDLDDWVKRVRALLCPGEVLHVVAGGNEKTWYVESSELVIGADYENYLARTTSSLDPDEEVLKRLQAVTALAGRFGL